ncbi:MAG: hypothetical protein K2N35_14545 [Muribaculaceae bacterium]|nr:hypothetical protein [Muribaculaceae bacterium]
MRYFVLHSDIIRVAVKQGWLVSVTMSEGNSFYFDFQRRTLGGLPFCFTAELSEGIVGTLVDEIISFVEELDPERYADEWSDASGQFSPTRYLQAVADMDDIRTRAWLLAVELSEIARRQDEVLSFQWFLWN